MCRLFAYISVKPILLDDVLKRPKNAITQQILAYWQGTPFLNADGFGVTWHTDARSNFNPFLVGQQQISEAPITKPVVITDGPLIPFVIGPHPAVYKTTIAKPLNDPVFISLCANVSSKTIFAHLRAAASPPVATTNNHPFVFGRHCFMQNGFITGFDEICKDMLAQTSDGFISMIEGGTDTEHFAALYFSYLCDPKDFRGADKHYEASLMWTALQSAIHKVEGIQKQHNIDVDNYMNICTTDGESLLALCYRSKIGPNTPPATLWVSSNVADTLNRKPYASTHGRIFEDLRSEDEINRATRELIRNAKPVIQRDSQGKIIGIDQHLLNSITNGEKPNPIRHGPHIVVASEPTTINPAEWLELRNRDAILVDTVLKTHGELQGDVKLGDIQSRLGDIQLKLGGIQSKLGGIQSTESRDNQSIMVQEFYGDINANEMQDVLSKLGDIQSKLGDIQSKLGTIQSKLGDIQSKSGDIQSIELGDIQSKLGNIQSKLGDIQLMELGDIPIQSNSKLANWSIKLGNIQSKLGDVLSIQLGDIHWQSIEVKPATLKYQMYVGI